MKMEIKKNKIIVFNNAFHGRTLTGILAGSNESHREGFYFMLNLLEDL